jgi:hypothetical protein
MMPHGAMVHDTFPPFPPNQKKKKKRCGPHIKGHLERGVSEDYRYSCHVEKCMKTGLI